MKIIISEGQFNEIVNRNKPIFGKGVFHRVFESKKYPDRVYKVGYKNVVDHWMELFGNHEELFPRIYIHKDFEYDNKEYTYVLVEKLDTNRFLIFWDELDDLSEKFLKMPFQYVINKMQFNEADDLINVIGGKISDEYENDFRELIKLINSLYDIYTRSDLHRGQFGYDKNGKIKCLDI